MTREEPTARDHRCVVCRQKMNAKLSVCPRCRRKAHLRDYEGAEFVSYKAGIIPWAAVLVLVGFLALVLFQLAGGRTTWGEVWFIFVLLIVVLLIFLVMTRFRIRLGEEFFIINGEVGYYADIIRAQDERAFDLRRDKRHVFYTRPPHVAEPERIDFAIPHICFAANYKDIIARITAKSPRATGEH